MTSCKTIKLNYICKLFTYWCIKNMLWC